MNTIVDIFDRTFDDRIFSKEERTAVKELLQTSNIDKQKADFLRHKIFEIARRELYSSNNIEIIDWLEQANKLILGSQISSNEKARNDVFFSPGNDCLNAIIGEIEVANKSIEICVFTISDNRISNKLVEAHKRSKIIKIISDNDKTLDAGSDIEFLARQGIEVKIDRTAYHMHHKFAIFDKRIVITGSYNWTKSAADYNEENILVTDNKQIIDTFQKQFDNMWREMDIY